jgi:ABC-type multidrug transport system ATPase subunit
MPHSTGQPPFAIETRSLTKRFGRQAAVSDVALRVEAGCIYGFLGGNGAGKTTTIRLILGLLRPTSGGVSVFGRDVARDRIAAAREVGSLLEARATYDQLSGRENLDGTRRLLGLAATEIDRVLDIVDMRPASDRKVGDYSLGMRQRLGLARALLGEPRLLVLDEPMNGLDPDGVRETRAVIRAMPERCGATVFLSSHQLSEVQQTVSHVGLMHEGRLVLQGPIEALLRQTTPELFVRTNDVAAAMRRLRQAGHAPEPDGGGLRITLKGGGDREASAVARLLVEAGLEVSELTPRQASLEDVYMQVQRIAAEAA